MMGLMCRAHGGLVLKEHCAFCLLREEVERLRWEFENHRHREHYGLGTGSEPILPVLSSKTRKEE